EGDAEIPWPRDGPSATLPQAATAGREGPRGIRDGRAVSEARGTADGHGTGAGEWQEEAGGAGATAARGVRITDLTCIILGNERMSKLETHSGEDKRFARTASGRFKHRRGLRSHILTKKS